MLSLCLGGGVDLAVQQQFWAQQLSIRRSTHTHAHRPGFWFPKKQKKRKKQSGKQAIPKRVLQSDRQQLVAATVQRDLISFYWENCGCSETAPTTTTPPYSPLSTQHLLPALAALALPLIRNTNKPKKRRATTTTRRRAIKTV